MRRAALTLSLAVAGLAPAHPTAGARRTGSLSGPASVALAAWRELLRWRGFQDAEHMGGGLVRLAPGRAPELIPAAVVVRVRGRDAAGRGPYRETEVLLADKLDAAEMRVASRLSAALFLLALLGTPLVVAAVYLR